MFELPKDYARLDDESHNQLEKEIVTYLEEEDLKEMTKRKEWK